ncbi:MAG: HAD family hydrolase, partial [Terriglobales bacterium]
MNKQPVRRALIFDMDGTLIDSEPLHLRAYQSLLSRFEITYTEEDNRQFLGRTDKELSSTLISRYDLKISAEQFVMMKEEILTELMSGGPPARPGVFGVLNAGKERNAPMAVASSATLETIEGVVDALEIRAFFDALVSGEEVAHGKPAPDVFLLAA